MNAVRVHHFIERATDHLESMRITRRDSYFNSAALLAIHCALCYSDALRTGLGGEKLSSDNHQRAVAELDKLIPSRRIPDRTGIAHLSQLIAKKSLVAYGDKRLAPQDFLDLVTKAERFARWANGVGKELKIQGWRDDA